MKKRPALTIITAGVLTAAVLVTTIGGNSVVLQAAGTMPGVEKIVEEKSSNGEPFRILEIVPTTEDGTKGTGDIGFLVDGEQKEYVESIATTEALNKAIAEGTGLPQEIRKNFVKNQILKPLEEQGILEWDESNDNTLPLYASRDNFYEETYEIPADDIREWYALVLDEQEIVQLNGSYQPVSAGETGSYSIQIDNFVISKDSNGDKAGEYNLSWAITDKTDPDNLGQKYGYYEEVAIPGGNGATEITYIGKDKTQLVEGKKYFVITGYTRVVDDPNTPEIEKGLYDAAVNSQNPYIYVGPGQGDYKFVEDPNEAPQNVVYEKVYYRVELESNNWFKTAVIDAVTIGTSDTPYVLDIYVETYSVQELVNKGWTQADLENYDMFYLASDFFKRDGMTYAMDENMTASASTVFNNIFYCLAQNNTPCIIDKRIMDEIAALTDASGNVTIADKIKNNPVYQWIWMGLTTPNPQELFSAYVEFGDIDWEELHENISKNTNDTYVTHNIYVANEELSKANLTTVFGTEQLAGFSEISEMIETVNFTRTEEEKLLTDISKAVAIQYIINYQITGSVTNKTSIKVLEIQPCYDFDYMVTAREQQDNKTDIIKQKTANINALLGSALGGGTLEYVNDEEFGSCVYRMTKNGNAKTVTVYGMTTAEYIGKIEDINTEYDLVYIGMNTGLMNTKVDDEGNVYTVYNDSAMDHLVYTHTGDAIQCKEGISGILSTDYLYPENLMLSCVYATSMRTGIHYNSDYGWKMNTAGETELIKPQISYKDIDVNFTVNSENEAITKRNVGNVNVYRFSGNDITQEKMNCLLDFIKAKYPLVLDKECLLYSETDVPLGPNAKKVDNTSWMYKFIEEAWDQPNVFVLDDVLDGGDEVANFKQYVNISKLSIVLHDYHDTVRSSSGKQLYYKFSFNSTVGSSLDTPYNVKLYVDMNRDGKYGSAESVPDFTLTDSDGKTVVAIDKMYTIYPNETYTLVRNLSDDYRGVVPWRLEVVHSNNSYLRTSVQGTVSIEATNSSQKEVIRILQIGQKANDRYGYTENWNLEKELNRTTVGWNEPPNYFYQYVKGNNKAEAFENDFTIEVKYLASDEYVREFDKAAQEGVNLLEVGYHAEGYKDIKNTDGGYNMLILGFTDVYRDIDNEIKNGNEISLGPVDGILKFISDGKSVLFTHDTTSYVNVPNENSRYYQYRNGAGSTLTLQANGNTATYSNGNYTNLVFWNNYNAYNLNTLLRNVVGMDRYGITNRDTSDPLMCLLKQGEVQRVQAAEENGDTTYMYLKDIDNIGDNPEYEAITKKDVAFAAGTWDEQTKTAYTYAETQGYNNNLLNVNCSDNSQYLSLSRNKSTINVYDNSNGAFQGSHIMYARRLNEGQITSYPYEISERIQISETHNQWYQLDMEADDDGDGNSDIVVWYTICDVEKNGKAVDNFYTASPNDARSNYYIYSKGNVMYSGVGHSQVKSEEEVKLFINTMVAAYQTAAKEPTVKILNNADPNSGEKKTETLFFDDYLADAGKVDGVDGVIDRNLEMYFIMEESNLVTAGTTTTAQFTIGEEQVVSESIKADDGTTTWNSMPVILYPAALENDMPKEVANIKTIEDAEAFNKKYGNLLVIPTLVAQDNKMLLSYPITAGAVYKAIVPNYYANLQQDNDETITVTVNSKFNYYGSAVEKETSTSLYTVRAGLFNLN